MLTFISDAQLPSNSAAVDRVQQEMEEEDELEAVSEVDTADSDTNSLFNEKQTTPEEKVNFYMDSMRRAERRVSVFRLSERQLCIENTKFISVSQASMGETMTVVTTESEPDEEPESGESSLVEPEGRPLDQHQLERQPLDQHKPERQSLDQHQSEDQQLDRHDPETKSKLIAFMETRRPSQRGVYWSV